MRIPAFFLIALLAAPFPAPANLQVTDDLGHRVTLEAPARRIVTLSPHATELLLALGLESRLVAVADFTGYPRSLDGVPRLASLGPLDRERLLLLRPDLVVAWASGNRPADLRWLEHTGIPVYRSEPRTLADIAESLRKLARLAGAPRAGAEAASTFERALEAACARRRNAPLLRVYYEIWPSPPMTLGGRHWLNEVLARARLVNVFADVPAGIVTVSREALLARPHDLVLTGNPEAAGGGSRIVTVDPTLERPGPRIVEGLGQLCRNLPTGSSAAPDRQAAASGRN